jgi:hypothetical protein
MTGEMQLTFGPEIEKLSAALVAFQGEVGSVSKSETAKVEKDGRLLYSYKYADLASVLEATREARAKAGLAVIQFPTGNGDGITLFTTVVHSSGQWMRGALTLRPMDTKPQTLGSLITYLRRYCYSAVLGIATEEDDDGAAAQGKPAIKGGAQPANKVKAEPSALMANATQVQQIHILKEKIGGWTGKADHDKHPYRAALLAYKDAKGNACTSSKELTYDQAANLIKRMQGAVDAQTATLTKMNGDGHLQAAVAEREPGSDDGEDPGEAADPGQLADVRSAAVDKWGKRTKDLAPQWLLKEFGVSEAAALSKVQASKALQMLLSGDVL